MGSTTVTNGPPFKDVMGRWRTHSLFRESYQSEELEANYPPVFTLGEEDLEYDGRVLPSMRRLFLSYEDPTGYAFAKEILGSYDHWKRLCKAPWFKQYLDSWMEEMEIRLLSDGLRKIKELAEGESGQAFNASRYLAERGWQPKKGRPKKEDVEREAKIQAGAEAAVEEDLTRLRLVK